MEDERNRKKKAAVIAAVIIIVLVVWFLSLHHDIDVEVEGEGTVSPDGVTVGHLGSATLEFIPADGWVLEKVLLDGRSVESDEGKLILKWIVSNHSVKAVFVEASIDNKHTLTVTSNGNGSTSPSGTSTYDSDAKVTLTITPDEGYVVDDVRVDGQSVGSRNNVEIVMSEDHTADVTFRKAVDASSGDTPADPWVEISVDVQIITTGADFGTVEPSGKVRVAYGGSLTVTIQLNEGYTLESVTADGISMGKSTVVTIDDIVADVDIDIVVFHAVRTYTVTASASSGGAITPSGEIKVIEGEDVTFTISARSGYRLSSLTVDGVSVGTGSTYTLEDVDKDMTVFAQFVSDSTPTPLPPVRTLESISVSTHPECCYIDRSIDESIRVIAHYSDGSSETVTGACSPTSWTSPGKKTVTVSYGGETCAFELTVPTLSGIDIATQPSRIVFAVNEAISLDGMVVTAEYTDSQYDRTATGWSFSPGSFDTAGAQTITASYTEGTTTVMATLEVTVVSTDGFSCTVVSYSGTKVENGAVVSFSYPTMSRSLEDFKFDSSNMVPGVKQTIRVEVTNMTDSAQDAYVYVSGRAGDDVLAQQIALYSETSSSTVYNTADGSRFVDLGTIARGSTAVFELTMEFVEGPENNQARGKTLTFSIGVFAGQEAG